MLCFYLISKEEVIALDLLRFIDNSILDFIRNFICHDVLDGIMAFFTHLGDMGIIWLTFGIAMLFFKKTRRFGLLVLLSLCVCAIISLAIMKPFFGRLRPYELRGIVPKIAPPGGSSFPSGHTASSFGAAYAIFLSDRRLGISAFTLASVIAFSRMYFLVHYPTDVIMGVFVGMCSTLIARFIVNFIESKIK